MDNLSDELVLSVLSFLSTPEDLKSFALTNKQWYKWIFASEAADILFLDLYHHHFRPTQRHPCGVESVVGEEGKLLWKNLYNLRHSLRQQQQSQTQQQQQQQTRGARVAAAPSSIREPQILCCNALQTLEILPSEEEKEALLYDNPEHDTLERLPCCGYFGMHPIARGAVAIWGDFAGLRVAPSWDALLNPRSHDRDRLEGVQDERQTQVMDLKVHPVFDNQLFLAFASGVVKAVVVQDDHELKVKSSALVHLSEVTCLALIPALTKDHPGYLISADVKGNVCLYPDALTQMSVDKQIWISEQIHNNRLPIFSMTATVFHTQQQQQQRQIVLCLGGQGLKLALWKLQHANGIFGGGVEVVERQEFDFERIVSDSTGDDDEDETEENEDQSIEHSINHASFVGPVTAYNNHPLTYAKDTLVLGTSRGLVLTLDFSGHVEDPNRPHLEFRFGPKKLHFCSAESTTRIGNMILSAGGKDGLVKAMDLVTGASLATLMVHPGRLLSPSRRENPALLKCAVVRSWVCHQRQSIVNLCRDGHISEWSFEMHTIHARGKRDAPDPLQNTSKRPRRSTNRNNPPLLVSRAQLPDSSATRNSMNRSQAAVPQPFQLPSVDDTPALLNSIPESARDYSNQIGFVPWKKHHLPVLVVSPLSIPPGPIRDHWLERHHKFQERKQRNSNARPPLLVYFYGATDPGRAYMVVSCSNFTPYEKAMSKRYHEIPTGLQRKIDSGAALTHDETERINGLRLVFDEADRAPMDRTHLLKNC